MNRLAWILLGGAVIIGVMPELVRRGWLRRNWFYGIRIKSTMASADAWRAGHAAAARLTYLAALSLAGSAVVVAVRGDDSAEFWPLTGALLCGVFVLIGTIRADRAARRLSQ